jgi:hypothetical protein
MAAHTLLNLQPSSPTDRLAGTWKLAPEQAVTLNPGQAGLLRVTQGCVWATLEGPHHGPANDWGDIVLRSGQQIRLLPGQQVVVESFTTCANDAAACFSWEPAATPVPQPAWVAARLAEPRARAVAGGLPGRALRALARALGALRWFVAGQGRVLSPLESNQP